MSPLEKRINSISKLSFILGNLASSNSWPGYECGINEKEYNNGLEAITSAVHHNGWFTPESVRKSLGAWAEELTQENIENWLKPYQINHNPNQDVAIIAAGNIPLVGLHDLITVILTGNRALLKLSTKDTILMMMVVNYIKLLDADLGSLITIVNGKMEGFSAVIATGSNNSSRYFEYYFKDKPAIIRRNRTSIAVLNGTESEKELEGLAQDIFAYFGLGCRNVTKLYVPQGYDLNLIFKALFPYKEIANHNKYANNYDYHRAIWLMNQDDLLENGFILLKQEESLVSPVGSLFYEYYSDEIQLRSSLAEKKDEIQCIVSAKDVPFGRAQKPSLADYADGVDTVEFLIGLP